MALTCGLGERPPAALAVGLDVGDEALVLLLGPRALVRVRLLAARGPPHAGRPSQDKAPLPSSPVARPCLLRRRGMKTRTTGRARRLCCKLGGDAVVCVPLRRELFVNKGEGGGRRLVLYGTPKGGGRGLVAGAEGGASARAPLTRIPASHAAMAFDRVGVMGRRRPGGGGGEVWARASGWLRSRREGREGRWIW